jgi:hypothetical protein
MTVYGKALDLNFPYASEGLYRRYAYECIGSSGYNGSCPATGTEVVLAESQVCIPQGHNGIVMFSAKSRVQGGQADGGGTVALYIKIDCVIRGSTGVQDLGPAPYGVSTRTIRASYLSAGASALDVGCHTVQVIGKAVGDFHNVVLNANLPLVWFD